ncbi:MAG: competence/damage-inducible protein A [Lachnospiraceae bacterium]|nr:competence/damage-inducible protein A [Lachnospiraceae bacterium]
MKVELISVGTEILMGNIINTNAAYLSRECAALGLSVYYEVTVGDNPDRLEKTIKEALEEVDIIILTGGLGPTSDDLTKEITAKAVGRNIHTDEHTMQRLKEYFTGRTNITANNWKTAKVIEGATVIDNHNGTAPGEIVSLDSGQQIILLPGPPNEMIPMFDQQIKPHLRALSDMGIYSKMVKVCGIGESTAEYMIRDLMEKQSNPTIAPYAKTAQVHFRVSAMAKDKAQADEIMAPTINRLKKEFGKCIYTMDEATELEEVVVDMLKERGYKLVTAESLTGGLIAATIVNVPGASDVLEESFVTYADRTKAQNLGVLEETLQKYTAVSKETAIEMAKGIQKRTGAQVSISATGIAGPDGGTKEKPVGLAFLGCCIEDKVFVKELHLKGNRRKIREMVVVNALDLIRTSLMD